MTERTGVVYETSECPARPGKISWQKREVPGRGGAPARGHEKCTAKHENVRGLKAGAAKAQGG